MEGFFITSFFMGKLFTKNAAIYMVILIKKDQDKHRAD